MVTATVMYLPQGPFVWPAVSSCCANRRQQSRSLVGFADAVLHCVVGDLGDGGRVEAQRLARRDLHRRHLDHGHKLEDVEKFKKSEANYYQGYYVLRADQG